MTILMLVQAHLTSPQLVTSTPRHLRGVDQ